MKIIITAFVTLMMSFSASSTVLVTYTGACNDACSNIGLTEDGEIQASLTLDIDTLPLGGNLNLRRDIVSSFEVLAGDIFLDSSLTSNFKFILDTNSDGDILFFQLLASLSPEGSSDESLFGDTVDLRSGGWFAVDEGQCAVSGDPFVPGACADTGFFLGTGQAIAFLSDAETTLRFEKVNEPTLLGLFGLVLMGLRFAKRSATK